MLLPQTPLRREVRRQADRRWPSWFGALACVSLLTWTVVRVRMDELSPALAKESSGAGIRVEADGLERRQQVAVDTVAALLDSMELNVEAHDRLEVQGQPVSLDTPLSDIPAAALLEVRRAVPFTLEEGGIKATLYATSRAVGDALWEAGVEVYAGDIVHPSLDTPLMPEMHVYLERSKPLTIVSDSQVLRTRTMANTVGQALSEEGIDLAGQDYCDPLPSTPIGDGQEVHVSRIAEEWTVGSESIPYSVVWQPDSSLELDQQRVAQTGAEGVLKRRYHITYENGRETDRQLETEWVDQEPQARILVYGTKIVWREIQTPAGVKRYWRHFRVLATSYTAATSGKTRSNPQYGITRLGWQARKGIIAVDPKVIPLTANLYVPGYGLGVAGDTGGMINGRHIDLCYDEWNLVLWYRWVDVYLLDPLPPTSKISWTLPSYPRE